MGKELVQVLKADSDIFNFPARNLLAQMNKLQSYQVI